MQPGKARVRHSDEVWISCSGEIRVSLIGKIG
jgi:hypothetical protein